MNLFGTDKSPYLLTSYRFCFSIHVAVAVRLCLSSVLVLRRVYICERGQYFQLFLDFIPPKRNIFELAFSKYINILFDDFLPLICYFSQVFSSCGIKLHDIFA